MPTEAEIIFQRYTFFGFKNPSSVRTWYVTCRRSISSTITYFTWYTRTRIWLRNMEPVLPTPTSHIKALDRPPSVLLYL